MRHLFFTGASGLLGGQLLARLLDHGRQVAVLVRPTAKASGRERIESILLAEEQILGKILPRPVVLEGDLTSPQCGLGDQEVQWVRRACSSILHSAAGPSTDEIACYESLFIKRIAGKLFYSNGQLPDEGCFWAFGTHRGELLLVFYRMHGRSDSSARSRVVVVSPTRIHSKCRHR